MTYDDSRIYWLSFADDDLGFLGACIVIVAAADRAAAAAVLDASSLREVYGREAGPWILAAIQQAWALGCNAGGQVMAVQMPPEAAAGYPTGVLLSKADLARLEGAPPLTLGDVLSE